MCSHAERSQPALSASTLPNANKLLRIIFIIFFFILRYLSFKIIFSFARKSLIDIYFSWPVPQNQNLYRLTWLWWFTLFDRAMSLLVKTISWLIISTTISNEKMNILWRDKLITVFNEYMRNIKEEFIWKLNEKRYIRCSTNSSSKSRWSTWCWLITCWWWHIGWR